MGGVGKEGQEIHGICRERLAGGEYDSSAFFAQQSAEMLLKAILLKRTGARPYTYSLSEMLESITQAFSVEIPEEVRLCAHKLERHYIASRYPDAGISDYDKSDAQEAVEMSQEDSRICP